MIDLDGTFYYSKIINVALENRINQIAVYPNPNADYLKIEIQSTNIELVTLLLINNLGKIIETKLFILTKGTNQFNWNIQSLVTENYFISNENFKFGTNRFLKQ